MLQRALSTKKDSVGGRLPTPRRIVSDAVESFGAEAFSFADLCSRIDERSPKVIPKRRIVARRFFDLRQGDAAIVEETTIPEKTKAGLLVSDTTRKYYRYRPPKPKITNPP